MEEKSQGIRKKPLKKFFIWKMVYYLLFLQRSHLKKLTGKRGREYNWVLKGEVIDLD